MTSKLKWNFTARASWFKSMDQLKPNIGTLMSGLAIPMDRRRDNHLLLFKSRKIDEDGYEFFNVSYTTQEFVTELIESIRCACCGQAKEQIDYVKKLMDGFSKMDDEKAVAVLVMADNDTFGFIGPVPDKLEEDNNQGETE